jgi:hypothetical protein
MDSDFFLYALHIFLRDVRNVDNFASVNRLCNIGGRSIALLFTLFNDLVGNLLSFHHLAVLAFTKLLVDID